MKKNLFIISLVLVFMFFSASSNAQNNRPIWLIGHGANWGNSIRTMLDYGANGVEIDVRTKGRRGNAQGKHWSVAHDQYWPENQCTGSQYSLKRYLTISDLNDSTFCLLWIDCKDDEYLKELVEYVHAATPNGTPYSIVYNTYNIEATRKNIAWVSKNLRENEGLNFSDVRPNPLSEYLSVNNVPYKQHFYTRGYFSSFNHFNKPGHERLNDITDARQRKENNKFCSRVGAWTAVKGWHGYMFFDGDQAYNSVKITTNYDVVLAYCKGGWRPLPFTTKVLKTCRGYINNSKYNNGKMRIANRRDKFFPKI